jgi:hypothetical protein
MGPPHHCVVVSGQIQQSLADEGIGLIRELADMPSPASVKFVVQNGLAQSGFRRAVQRPQNLRKKN